MFIKIFQNKKKVLIHSSKFLHLIMLMFVIPKQPDCVYSQTIYIYIYIRRRHLRLESHAAPLY